MVCGRNFPFRSLVVRCFSCGFPFLLLTPCGSHKRVPRPHQKRCPQLQSRIDGSWESAKAPISQPIDCRQGSNSAICRSFSASHDGRRLRWTTWSAAARSRNRAVERHSRTLFSIQREAIERVYFPFGRAREPVINMEGNIEFDSEFERSLFELRRSKLAEIEKLGQAAYPNQFPAIDTFRRSGKNGARRRLRVLEGDRVTVAVAGRIMAIRAQGKAGFATMQQGGQRLQIYVRLDCRRRAGVCPLQIARPGRSHWRRRLSFPHAHGRADRARRAT